MSAGSVRTAGQSVAVDRREERRNAILDAAEHLFLEQGYERVSLAAIVKRSGGSLATVYEMFGNKQGLLRTVVDRSIEQDFGDPWSLDEDIPPSRQLRVKALRMHAYMIQPRTVAMKRIVIGESLRDPAFGRNFYDTIHRARLADLSVAFRAWTEQGRAAIDDPDAAAELYIATVVCEAQHEALLGIKIGEDMDRIAAAIDWRLAPFLNWFRIV